MLGSNLKKPVFVFFPMDMPSHHLRCMQLADAIKDFAKCVFVTQKYFEMISSRGFEVLYCDTLSAEMIIKKGQEGDSSWVAVNNLEPILEKQIQLLKSLNPDYIVNDYSFTAHLAAERTGITCISLVNGLFSKKLAVDRGVPPSHPLSLLSFLFPQFLIRGIQNVIFKLLHSPYRKLRKKWGLSQKNNSFLDEFEADINLLVDSSEFAPQTDFPGNTYYLGPLFHTDTKSEEQVLAKLDPEKKTILVNMGSGGLVERAKFLNDPRFSEFNILYVGAPNDILNADHIIKEKFLSLEAILPKVDLVINQAGTGNIFQSLSHGLPIFCYPTFFEQEWNALRAQELGYGLCLTGKESTSEMHNLVSAWIEKKNESKFNLLKQSINVQETKLRFRQIVSGLLRRGVSEVKQNNNANNNNDTQTNSEASKNNKNIFNDKNNFLVEVLKFMINP